jgi:hypothetical protein
MIATAEPLVLLEDATKLPEGVLAVYQVGPQTVVVETLDRREIRITAKHDLRTGEYQSECERRAPMEHDGYPYHVWTLMPTNSPCVAADPDECLDAAIRHIGATVRRVGKHRTA